MPPRFLCRSVLNEGVYVGRPPIKTLRPFEVSRVIFMRVESLPLHTLRIGVSVSLVEPCAPRRACLSAYRLIELGTR